MEFVFKTYFPCFIRVICEQKYARWRTPFFDSIIFSENNFINACLQKSA